MYSTNEFHQAALEKMNTQLNYLQELLGRDLTLEERDNIHGFYETLDLNLQYEFESKLGRLL